MTNMKEREREQTEEWYARLIDIASKRDSGKRYSDLVRLHSETLGFYLAAIEKMTDQDADARSSDGRAKKLVVAHISGWEEWQVQVFKDPNRAQRLEKQMKLQGYLDTDANQMLNFQNVDEFNKYQTDKYANRNWSEIRQKAIDTALELQAIFPVDPPIDWINFLDSTPPKVWKLTENQTVTIPSAWYLWMVSLEHEAVEHRGDLIL